MAKNKNLKQHIVATEQSFQYETKFNKTQKTIKQFQLVLFIFTTFFLFLANPYYPMINGIISFFIAFFLWLNAISVIDIKKEIEKIGVNFEPNKEYFIKIGDAVSSIEDIPFAATIMNPKKSRKEGFNPEAMEYPILVKDTQMLTHMFVIGTTGSGKTTFLVNILEQVLQLGGGSMAVDGKGDQSVYEAFYNTAIDCGREDDFFVINYNVPEESNTMNPLLKGSADEISDIIGNMLDQSGDNAFWAGRALAMMKGLLSVLIPLKNAGLLFTPDGEKVEILTFSLLQEWISANNLKKLYYTIKVSNQIAQNIYQPFKNSSDEEFPEKILEYLHGVHGLEEEQDDDDKYQYMVDKPFKLQFTQEEQDNFQKLSYLRNEQNLSGINLARLQSYMESVYISTIDEFEKITEGSSKQHGNSFLMWNESLDLIGGRFGKIFDTKFPEIDMQDVVSNGRILYILLPSLKVDPRTLSILGKIILGFFKQSISVLLGDKISGSIEERYRSFAIRPRIPFWAVMDEYGAYAVEGFDNVLAQARSLKVSVSILVQEMASLKKANELEAQRLLGNTGLKIILKLEEQNSIEDAIKFVGEEEQAFVRTSKVDEYIDERSIAVEKRNILTTQMLQKMDVGHAYIKWAGLVVPALVRFYEPPIAKVIPRFSEFKTHITQKYYRKIFVKNYQKEHLKEYNIYFSSKNKILEKENLPWGTGIK